jgi:spermidine synthase
MASMSRLERVAVYVVVFLSGALLMALEIAAFRIIGKTFGSALRETTAVIAVFLAAMSIGYWVGGRAGDRWPRPGTLVSVLLAAAAVLLIVPWLDALLSPRIARSNLELSTHAFAATTLLFALPTILFASVSPIAIRLFAAGTGRSGSTAGSISAVSTVGSIAGSVVTAFLLIDQLRSITRTVMVVALCACITAIVLIATTMPFRRSVPAVGVALVLAAPALAFIGSTQIEQSLFKPLPNWRVLFVGDSPYHRVTVLEHRGLMRALKFASATQSVMYLQDPFGPGLRYADSVHLARLLRPSVRRVLVIGLGGGTIPKQFTHYYPDTVVDVVDVDPLVVDVAQKYFGVQPSDRLRVHLADGRLFLRRATEKWDLIVIDTYTTNRYGDTIPPHLVTQEFFSEVSRHLSDGGILHFHCAFEKGKLLSALQKTLASVFGSVYVTEGEILASDVALVTSKETALQRVRDLPAGRLLAVEGYLEKLRPYERAAADVPLLTDDYAPVDTLLMR